MTVKKGLAGVSLIFACVVSTRARSRLTDPTGVARHYFLTVFPSPTTREIITHPFQGYANGIIGSGTCPMRLVVAGRSPYSLPQSTRVRCLSTDFHWC